MTFLHRQLNSERQIANANSERQIVNVSKLYITYVLEHKVMHLIYIRDVLNYINPNFDFQSKKSVQN